MAAPSLRVGVILSSATQPAWVCRVLSHIRAAHRLAFVSIVSSSAKAAEAVSPSWFRRVDDAIFGRKRDGMTPCDVQPLLDGVPSERADADVVLALAPYEDAGRARVWTIDKDGLWEFATRRPTLRAVLRANGEVRAETSAMPEPASFRRAMSRLGLRTAAMIEHELSRQSAAGSPQEQAVPAPAPHALRPAPSMPRMLSRSVISAAEYVRQTVRYRWTRGHWSIAFAFGAGLDFRRYHRVVPPRDRLWADPFVVARGDRAWIFIEELLYSENRGVISVMEVHRDGTWSPPRRVLERPYHLSYPCVFEWTGEFFMLPETQQNGTIELYRCVDFPYRWEPDMVLMAGMNAVDSTIFEAHGRWWMYTATDSGDGAGFDRLWLYHAPSPRGPWTPHRQNPLECNVIGGRPAGRPFVRDGKLLRAGQVGAPWYGHAMQLREIVTLTPDAWEEREVAMLPPDWDRGLDGTHTLNVDGEVAVIDALRVRWGRPR